MAYISHSKIAEFMGQPYLVNANVSGLYTGMLRQILSQCEAILSFHNKALLVRFDLHQPEYTESSKDVTQFFKRFLESLKRQYDLNRVGYGWVREQEKAKSQHYHCFVIVDGNKVRTSYWIVEHILWQWTVNHDGTIHWPSPCYHMMKRGRFESIQPAIYHLSYLAKGRGKGYKPRQAKNYGTSRLKVK